MSNVVLQNEYVGSSGYLSETKTAIVKYIKLYNIFKLVVSFRV